MHQCPACGSEETYLADSGPEDALMVCWKCPNRWRVLTVPEPYLRDLIARSLGLAALKAGAVR